MNDSLSVSIFYPDAEAPEGGVFPLSSLSAWWLGVCREILASGGPVIHHNMGSTLSHFDVQLAGPMGQFSAYGNVQFDLAILSGGGSAQDEATTAWFIELWRRRSIAMGHSPSIDVLAAVRSIRAGPSAFIFDHVDSGTSEDQKEALFQLVIHFVAASLRSNSAEVLRQNEK